MKAKKLLDKITENKVLVAPSDVNNLLDIAYYEGLKNDEKLEESIIRFKSKFVITDWPTL